MKILSFPESSLISLWALGAVLWLGVPGRTYQGAAAQQASGSAGTQVEDAEVRSGPFLIAGENYTVVVQQKRLASASESAFSQTLARVEIVDASGNVVYSKAFPAAIERGHFQNTVSASTQPTSGTTGTGLVMRYVERHVALKTSSIEARESWQLFGLVNGKLAPLGKPAVIGTPAAGGAFMGVMMRAANGTVSVIGQPDTIEVRAWSGSFYVFVPLRVNWGHGGLAQGHRCVEMFGGALREVGCDMRVEADRKPFTEEFTFVRLLPEAQENPDAAEHVVVQKDSKVEILGARAIVTWDETGELIRPVFSDVWLHVRIDQHEGWIAGEEDFAAIGLPAGSSAP
jgi:hypothetical protein